jgi:hypothetical protein
MNSEPRSCTKLLLVVLAVFAVSELTSLSIATGRAEASLSYVLILQLLTQPLASKCGFEKGSMGEDVLLSICFMTCDCPTFLGKMGCRACSS